MLVEIVRDGILKIIPTNFNLNKFKIKFQNLTLNSTLAKADEDYK